MTIFDPDAVARRTHFKEAPCGVQRAASRDL